jgi:hypothetical protein
LELVREAMYNAQVLEEMEKKNRWKIFILKWIRNKIMKREGLSIATTCFKES